MRNIKSLIKDSLSSARLRKIRTDDLQISQKDLACCLGVSARTVQGWEIDKSRPITPIVRLIQLLKFMPGLRKILCAPSKPQAA
jgi:DNA-binding transcriptional regulator YiaG